MLKYTQADVMRHSQGAGIPALVTEIEQPCRNYSSGACLDCRRRERNKDD
jgi:hypothetical protein